MNEEICVLTGVRPEIRARASAEAARLGLSLADYLADILLQISIVDAHAEVARDDCDQRWDSKFHLQDLRALRECMEERLAESAAHVAALAERLAQNERAQAVSSEQAHQLHAALAADLARETHTHHCALQAAREDFAGGVAELRDRQFEALARFEQLEAAVIGWASDLADVRDTVEMRLEWASAEARVNFSRAQAGWNAASIESAQARRALRADIERVEACTLAALEKLGGDRDAGDAALARLGQRLEALEQRQPVPAKRGVEPRSASVRKC